MPKLPTREQARCSEEDWAGRERCKACPIYELIKSQTDSKILVWLEQVLGAIEIYRPNPAEVICLAGEKGKYIFSVRDGIFKAVRYSQGGEYRIVRLFKGGENFGLELLASSHLEHSVVAVDQSEICRIPLSVVKKVGEEVPELCEHLMEEWHNQLRQADTWIVQFSTGTVRSRLARLIIYLSAWHPEGKYSTVRLLPGQELAAILGVAPESISRVIAEWKRQKVLQRLPGIGLENYRFDSAHLEQVAEASL